MDLARYECKYTIPETYYAPIYDFVRCYAEPDEATAAEGPGGYLITSLYLDSPDYQLHFAKLDKIAHRFKLRIRTYGRPGEHPTFMEIKYKHNGVIAKRRVELCGIDWWERWERGEQILKHETPFARKVQDEFFLLQSQLLAGPACLIRYRREAYTSQLETYGRITFDRQIEGHRPEGYRLDVSEDGWYRVDDAEALELEEPGLVLELKFADRAPCWMIDLVERFGLQQRGFSKYSNAIERAFRYGL